MRPPRESRSALRYPLDVVFGAELHVRLVRALLYDASEALSVSDAARIAGASTVGARKALERLESVGFVRRVGSGRALKFEVNPAAVAREEIAGLFELEELRFEALISGLREAVSLPEVLSAWRGELPHTSSSPIELMVIVKPKDLTWIRDELRTRVSKTEQRFNVIVELVIWTRADAPQLAEGAAMLWGLAPGQEGRVEHPPKTHEEATARSYMLASRVAELIRTDPSLIGRAQRHLDRQIREGQGIATADLMEWRQVLDAYSPERIRDLLVSGTSRGVRLRRSAPFFAVLTPEQRESILDERGAR